MNHSSPGLRRRAPLAVGSVLIFALVACAAAVDEPGLGGGGAPSASGGAQTGGSGDGTGGALGGAEPTGGQGGAATGGEVPGTGGAGTGAAPGTGGAVPTLCADESQTFCPVPVLACVTLGTAEHCAGCGDACDPGFQCVDEECVCASGVVCGVTCTHTTSDEANCSGCGVTCGLNALCEDSVCGCTDPAFPDAHANASTGKTECFDYDSDAAHCGDYATACLPGEDCVGGDCQCDASKTYCGSGADQVCADLDTSPDHCLGCGNRCPEAGVCTPTGCQCQGDRVVCGAAGDDPGRCADTSSDATACGAGCVACGVGEICDEGSCECPTGWGQCLLPGGGLGCFDTDTDDDHCGGDCEECGAGEDCAGGACITAPCEGLCTGWIKLPSHLQPVPAGPLCYEVLPSDRPNVATNGSQYRYVGNDWSRPLFVNGAAAVLNASDQPLGAQRAGGWCVHAPDGPGVNAWFLVPND